MNIQIERDDYLYGQAEGAGLAVRHGAEPDADALQGRYRYDGQSGQVFGPSGKPLKPVRSARGWRVGLYLAKGRVVSVDVGRVAFAIQHGRWPVAVRYVNLDRSDFRAANIIECRSAAYRRVENSGLLPAETVRDRRSLVREGECRDCGEWFNADRVYHRPRRKKARAVRSAHRAVDRRR